MRARRARRDPKRAELALLLLDDADYAIHHARMDDMRAAIDVLADQVEEMGYLPLATSLRLSIEEGRPPLDHWHAFRARVRRASKLYGEGRTPAAHAIILEREGVRLRAKREYLDAADHYETAVDFWNEAGDDARGQDALRQARGLREFGSGWRRTRVVFRRFPSGGVVAILPDAPWGPPKDGYFHSYWWDGQSHRLHRSAMDETRAATPREYRALFTALTNRGRDLVIAHRLPKGPPKSRSGA